MQFAENSEKLSGKISELRYKKRNYSNSEICDLLGEYTEVYELEWNFDLTEYGLTFKADGCSELKVRALPGDFLMGLQELLYVANRNFKQIHYDSFSYSYECYFSSDRREEEESWLTRCEKCGNVWDGNAQCMCFMDFSSGEF